MNRESRSIVIECLAMLSDRKTQSYSFRMDTLKKTKRDEFGIEWVELFSLGSLLVYFRLRTMIFSVLNAYSTVSEQERRTLNMVTVREKGGRSCFIHYTITFLTAFTTPLLD